MEARTYIVPVVQLASQAAPWLFVAGLALIVFGGWMLNRLVVFAKTLIANIPQYL